MIVAPSSTPIRKDTTNHRIACPPTTVRDARTSGRAVTVRVLISTVVIAENPVRPKAVTKNRTIVWTETTARGAQIFNHSPENVSVTTKKYGFRTWQPGT